MPAGAHRRQKHNAAASRIVVWALFLHNGNDGDRWPKYAQSQVQWWARAGDRRSQNAARSREDYFVFSSVCSGALMVLKLAQALLKMFGVLSASAVVLAGNLGYHGRHTPRRRQRRRRRRSFSISLSRLFTSLLTISRMYVCTAMYCVCTVYNGPYPSIFTPVQPSNLKRRSSHLSSL